MDPVVPRVRDHAGDEPRPSTAPPATPHGPNPVPGKATVLVEPAKGLTTAPSRADAERSRGAQVGGAEVTGRAAGRRAVTVEVHRVRSVAENSTGRGSVAPMPIRALVDGGGQGATGTGATESRAEGAQRVSPSREAAQGSQSQTAAAANGERAGVIAGAAPPSFQETVPWGERRVPEAGQDRAIVVAVPRPLTVHGITQQLARSPQHLVPRAHRDSYSEELEAPPSKRGVSVTNVHLPPKNDRETLALIDAPGSARAEAFRLLRHRLHAADAPLSIAVASPSRGEEASLCAIELALACAEATTANVLLIEVDVRSPRVARTLGLPVDDCFTDQVRGTLGTSKPWEVLSVFRSNLHLLPVNPENGAPYRIQSAELKSALGNFVELGYDQIIVTCPKVLDSADVTLFAGAVDCAVLTGPMRTTAKELRNAARALAPTKVLGVALLESE